MKTALAGVTLHETPSGKFRTGVLHDRAIVSVIAGPGRAAAARATESLLVAHRPRLVISAGFCGGLVATLKRNDIVVAEKILAQYGATLVIDPATLARFRFADAHRGSFAEVDRIVAKSADKRALAIRSGAIACEMESSAVAEVCAARHTFLAVRVVSDTVDEDLPDDLGPLMEAQTPMRTFGAVVGTLWRRPSSVKDLLKLQETALTASDRLAKFLADMVTQLPAAAPRRNDASTLADEQRTSAFAVRRRASRRHSDVARPPAIALPCRPGTSRVGRKPLRPSPATSSTPTLDGAARACHHRAERSHRRLRFHQRSEIVGQVFVDRIADDANGQERRLPRGGNFGDGSRLHFAGDLAGSYSQSSFVGRLGDDSIDLRERTSMSVGEAKSSEGRRIDDKRRTVLCEDLLGDDVSFRFNVATSPPQNPAEITSRGRCATQQRLRRSRAVAGWDLP